MSCNKTIIVNNIHKIPKSLLLFLTIKLFTNNVFWIIIKISF